MTSTKGELGKDEIVKSIGSLINGLFIFFIIFFLFFRWYASSYNRFVIFVHVKDEKIFKKTLNSSDPDLLDFGRTTKKEITAIDIDRDNGDGPGSGKLRWYVCGGIDCDEGWENRFIN